MTSRMQKLSSVAVLVGLLSVTSAGLAKDDETVAAGETFRAAADAYARGDFEAAARSFEVSHRLAPHPNTIYNAGLAWQAAGQIARAADALTEALAMDGISDAQRTDGEARLTELRPQLGVAHVVAPAGTRITIAHADKRATPLSIHLSPGAHELSAELADGRTVSREIVVAAAEEIELDLSSAAPAAPDPRPAPKTTPQALPVAPPPASRNDAQWVSGWVLAGAGVVSGGVAIGLGVAALGARDEFEASGNTDRDARDTAATLRTATNVMWAAAGALAVTGTLLLVFSGSEPESPTVSLGVGSLGVALAGARDGGLTFSGTF